MKRKMIVINVIPCSFLVPIFQAISDYDGKLSWINCHLLMGDFTSEKVNLYADFYASFPSFVTANSQDVKS